MPRKQKKGLDFFYLQCDIFSKNSELRPLLQRYKADGLAVYLHILCDVYSNGYYFKTVDFDGYLCDIAEDCGITVDKVQLIIAFMQGVSLIYVKSNLTDKNTVITSHGIQKHYVEAMKYRKHSVAEIKGEFWLLDKKEESELDTFYKSQPSKNKSEIYTDKSKIYADNSKIYDTKEIKGKEIKLKENKIDNNTHTSGERARAGKLFDSEEYTAFVERFNIVTDNYSVAINDMDFDLLSKAFDESKNFLQNPDRPQQRYLSWICRNYEKIIGGYYKDKPTADADGDSDYKQHTRATKPKKETPFEQTMRLMREFAEEDGEEGEDDKK